MKKLSFLIPAAIALSSACSSDDENSASSGAQSSKAVCTEWCSMGLSLQCPDDTQTLDECVSDCDSDGNGSCSNARAAWRSCLIETGTVFCFEYGSGTRFRWEGGCTDKADAVDTAC